VGDLHYFNGFPDDMKMMHGCLLRLLFCKIWCSFLSWGSVQSLHMTGLLAWCLQCVSRSLSFSPSPHSIQQKTIKSNSAIVLDVLTLCTKGILIHQTSKPIASRHNEFTAPEKWKSCSMTFCFLINAHM
jgi:hypothetical protein